MKLKHIGLLIMLAAIWGSSFILMRVLAPAIGPVTTAFLRIFIAGIAFVIYFLISRKPMYIKDNWWIYLLIGLINSAIPFVMFSYAALYIPAGISAVINSMTPMMGLVFAALILGNKILGKDIVGIVFGVIGVAIIQGGALTGHTQGYLAIGACLVAAICYGLGSTLIKKYAAGIDLFILAGLSLLFGSFTLLPVVVYQLPVMQINTTVILAMLLLSLICSGLAYSIYFYLISEVGPTKALTVTFLIPVFSFLWGYVCLGEALTINMLFGMAVIFIGTGLVLNIKIFNRKT